MAAKTDLQAAFSAGGRQLWLVGGAIRDRLLLIAAGDEDYATDAPPDEIEAIASQIGARSVAVGKRFGTIAVEIDGAWVEITTFRGESYAQGTRWPDVTFGTNIEEDLARRDFTVNAIAEDAASGRLLDPFGGIADLNQRVLRAVGEPEQRFVEDPLRILRAVRFVSQLGFTVEERTFAAMSEQAGRMSSLSVERITAELNRLLAGDHPAEGLRALADCGGLPVVLGELADMPGCEQNSFHRFDVWEHTLATVGSIEGAGDSLRFRRWAALLHDVGKPAVRHKKPNGEWGFYRHETVGASIAEGIVERLRLPKHEREAIVLLVRRHMDRPLPDDRRAVRRFMHRSEGLWEDLLALKVADNTSHTYDDSQYHSTLADTCHRLAGAEQEALKAESPLSGDDLMALLGRAPGPWIRQLKDRLGAMVLDGDIAPGDREEAMKIARAFVIRQPKNGRPGSR